MSPGPYSWLPRRLLAQLLSAIAMLAAGGLIWSVARLIAWLRG